MSVQTYYSHGKLMVTGEYLALAGSLVLAVPLRFGQNMKVEMLPDTEPCITWTALEYGRQWYGDVFRGSGFEPNNPNNPTSSNLQKLLLKASELNQAFPVRGFSFNIITDTNFSLNWGLGSSSTLISNLAFWAGVDPYTLLFDTVGGSGYDIACARSNEPIIYRFNGADHSPTVCKAGFDPSFSQNLWFVYTGSKQSSAKSIAGINPQNFDLQSLERISELTLKMSRETDLQQFMQLIRVHEAVVARAINQEPLQEVRFDDFPGVIKSLGAWGGDFCMAASAQSQETVKQYFASRGCNTVFNFSEIVLK